MRSPELSCSTSPCKLYLPWTCRTLNSCLFNSETSRLYLDCPTASWTPCLGSKLGQRSVSLSRIAVLCYCSIPEDCYVVFPIFKSCVNLVCYSILARSMIWSNFKEQRKSTFYIRRL